MLISVLFFALMNLVVKSLQRLPTTEIVLFRSVISLLLSVYYLRRHNIHMWGNNKLYLVLRGVFGVTALTLFFYTLHHLPIGAAITIQYLSPIFTVLIASWFLKEKTQPIQWLFFLVSFLGVLLIKGFDTNVDLRLLVIGIVSALFAGLAYNAIRKLKDSEHPMVIVLYFPMIAIPVMLGFSYFYWETPVGIEWLYILLMGIFTQIAQFYMTKAFQASEVRFVAGLKYLGILFAIGFDFFVFGYTHSLFALLGMALVVAGVVLNLLRKSPK